jgi:hypothetical protein
MSTETLKTRRQVSVSTTASMRAQTTGSTQAGNSSKNDSGDELSGCADGAVTLGQIEAETEVSITMVEVTAARYVNMDE